MVSKIMSDRHVRNQDRRIFVGNLDFRTTASDIREMFSGSADVKDVFFPPARRRPVPDIGRERKKDEPINYGCAFVEFASIAQVQTIFHLEGLKDPYGREIYISASTTKNERNSGRSRWRDQKGGENIQVSERPQNSIRD